MRQRYVRAANTNALIKQTCDYDHAPDFYSPAGAIAPEL